LLLTLPSASICADDVTKKRMVILICADDHLRSVRGAQVNECAHHYVNRLRRQPGLGFLPAKLTLRRLQRRN